MNFSEGKRGKYFGTAVDFQSLQGKKTEDFPTTKTKSPRWGMGGIMPSLLEKEAQFEERAFLKKKLGVMELL